MWGLNLGIRIHLSGLKVLKNDDKWEINMDISRIILEYWIHFVLASISSFLTYLFLKLNKKFKQFQEREKATENGVQALLRNEIIKTYNHYSERGFMPIHERDNINHLYTQYKNLGGNGTVPKLIEELEELPVHDISVKMKGEIK